MKSSGKNEQKTNRMKQLTSVAFFLSLITPWLHCTDPHNEWNSIKQINHLLALKV